MSRDNPVEVAKGSCIDLDLVYKDAAGAVEDVSDDVFAVSESTSDAAFADAVITKPDPVNGAVHFHLGVDGAALLSPGNVNWFRISRTGLDGCVENSQPIWVKIL